MLDRCKETRNCFITANESNNELVQEEAVDLPVEVIPSGEDNFSNIFHDTVKDVRLLRAL